MLRLGRTLAGLAVPDPVLGALAPRMPSVARSAIERHFILHLLPSESIGASVALSIRVWELAMQPGRLGHGPARPWDRTAAYKPSATVAARPRVSGVRARLGRIRTLGTYTRAMLGAR